MFYVSTAIVLPFSRILSNRALPPVPVSGKLTTTKVSGECLERAFRRNRLDARRPRLVAFVLRKFQENECEINE